jgi:hypothetical protein
MEPKHGNPPSWAQACMLLCVGTVVFQVVAGISVPLLDPNAQIQKPPREAVQGQVILKISNPRLKVIGKIVSYVPLLFIYGGTSALLLSIFLMKPPSGQAAPAVSTAANCVVSLTTLYFLVLASMYIAQTILQPSPENPKSLLTAFDAAQRAVIFSPMLCLVFVAARMRALQLTRTTDDRIPPGAGPQTWAQNAMYFSTFAMFLQVTLAFVWGKSLADELHKPRDGSEEDVRHKRTVTPTSAVYYSLALLSHLCLLAMFGGAVVVMVGIYHMTPETLPPYHSDKMVLNLLQWVVSNG